MRQNMGMRLDSVDDLRAPAIQMIAHPEYADGSFWHPCFYLLLAHHLADLNAFHQIAAWTIVEPNHYLSDISERLHEIIELLESSPGSIWPLMLMSLILM